MTQLPEKPVSGEVAEVTVDIALPPEATKQTRQFVEGDIKFILPHRGAMLLLDRVTITPGIIYGVLEVNPERCVGFCFLEKEELVLRGADFIEMAAQLLGIWGAQFPDFMKRKRKFVLARTGRAEFHKPVRAGEKVYMEINPNDIKTKKGVSSGRYIIYGSKFLAKVDEEIRAKIFDITLISAV